MAAPDMYFSHRAGRYVGERREHRISIRTLIVASGTVYFRENRHVGLIRDISREGLFVYTDFKPNIGDTLRVVVNGRNEASDQPVTCTGTVVRVESKATGAAVGIALKITAYEF